jgi:hypothetical protein
MEHEGERPFSKTIGVIHPTADLNIPIFNDRRLVLDPRGADCGSSREVFVEHMDACGKRGRPKPDVNAIQKFHAGRKDFSFRAKLCRALAI